ncbi:MAG: hypothetical protein AB7T49_15485 [Oligoflexales bacterium]
MANVNNFFFRWLMKIGAIVCMLLLSSCKTKATGSSSKNEGDASQVQLSASDLSILVPLKLGDSNGICNAPGLDLNGTKPIIPRREFLKLATAIYIETPQNAGKFIRKQKNKPAVSNPDFEAKVAKIQSGEGTDDDAQRDLLDMCTHLTKDQNIRQLTMDPFATLLKFDVSAATVADHVDHLPIALSRHKDYQICQYESWRIVGLRFDVCSNRAQIPDLQDEPSLSDSCMGEVRMVAQPVLCAGGTSEKCVDNNAKLLVKDFSFHLIFRAPKDWKPFYAKLKQMARVSRQENPNWNLEANERLLQPHYGLSAEMNTCDGPVSKEFRSLIEGFATYENLVNITWMGTSDGPAHWSFGSGNQRNGRWVASAGENFNTNLLEANTFPFDSDATANFTTDFHHVAKYFQEGQGQTLPHTISGSYKVASEILNPRIVSQLSRNGLPVPMNAVDTSCVSCHTSEQTLTTLAQQAGIDPEKAYIEGNGYQAAKQFEGPAPAWPEFTKTKSGKQAFKNLRNFGYGLELRYGVSRRVINETDDLLVLTNHFNF